MANWAWQPQRRRAQTFAASNQTYGTKALDQAQQSKRRVHVQKRPGAKKYNGVTREPDGEDVV